MTFKFKEYFYVNTISMNNTNIWIGLTMFSISYVPSQYIYLTFSTWQGTSKNTSLDYIKTTNSNNVKFFPIFC